LPRENPIATVAAIAAVYRCVADFAELLESTKLASDTMYLLGAMATGQRCQFSRLSRIVHVLKAGLPSDHEVWKYIEVLH
jgi:hypothetical protein